jgi:seryl-tRNA synthetase
VISIVSGALNNAAAKKYDLEAWFPGRGVYRELVSCSNCCDYQSRAMNTKFAPAAADSKKKDEKKEDASGAPKFVHMLNATLCATERTLCCLLENYQTDTGVRVPDVLKPFCGGIDFFPFVRKMPKAWAEQRAKEEKEAKAAAASAGKAAAAAH